MVPLPDGGAVNVVVQAVPVPLGMNVPPRSLDHVQADPAIPMGRTSPRRLNAIACTLAVWPGRKDTVRGTTSTSLSESK